MCIIEARRRQSVLMLTGFCSAVSFISLCVAVVTDYWLYATERITNENGTVILKNTSTGLWRKCIEGEERRPGRYCLNIQYFVSIDRDGLTITESIILSLRRFTLFPLISLAILFAAEVMCFVAYCRHKKSVYALVSGILFVIGGLFTLMGIVLYIGAITEEVGNKSKSAMDEAPKFIYHYGSSFILTIFSFITSEMNGVFSVYLYISQYQLAYHKEQEQLTLTDQNRELSPTRGVPSRGSNGGGGSTASSPPRTAIGYTYVPMSQNCCYDAMTSRVDVMTHVTPPVVENCHPQRGPASLSSRSPKLSSANSHRYASAAASETPFIANYPSNVAEDLLMGNSLGNPLDSLATYDQQARETALYNQRGRSETNLHKQRGRDAEFFDLVGRGDATLFEKRGGRETTLFEQPSNNNNQSFGRQADFYNQRGRDAMLFDQIGREPMVIDQKSREPAFYEQRGREALLIEQRSQAQGQAPGQAAGAGRGDWPVGNHKTAAKSTSYRDLARSQEFLAPNRNNNDVTDVYASRGGSGGGGIGERGGRGGGGGAFAPVARGGAAPVVALRDVVTLMPSAGQYAQSYQDYLTGGVGVTNRGEMLALQQLRQHNRTTPV